MFFIARTWPVQNKPPSRSWPRTRLEGMSHKEAYLKGTLTIDRNDLGPQIREKAATRAYIMIQALVAILLILFACSIALRHRRSFKLPLPPGPPSDPILGHLRYIPPENPELRYAEWAKVYGKS